MRVLRNRRCNKRQRMRKEECFRGVRDMHERSRRISRGKVWHKRGSLSSSLQRRSAINWVFHTNGSTTHDVHYFTSTLFPPAFLSPTFQQASTATMARSTSSHPDDDTSSWAYGQPVPLHPDNHESSTKQSSRGFFSRFRPTTSSWHTARRTGHTGASSTVASREPFDNYSSYPDEETTQAGRHTQFIPRKILAGFTQKLRDLKGKVVDKTSEKRTERERRKRARAGARKALARHTDFWHR